MDGYVVKRAILSCRLLSPDFRLWTGFAAGAYLCITFEISPIYSVGVRRVEALVGPHRWEKWAWAEPKLNAMVCLKKPNSFNETASKWYKTKPWCVLQWLQLTYLMWPVWPLPSLGHRTWSLVNLNPKQCWDPMHQDLWQFLFSNVTAMQCQCQRQCFSRKWRMPTLKGHCEQAGPLRFQCFLQFIPASDRNRNCKTLRRCIRPILPAHNWPTTGLQLIEHVFPNVPHKVWAQLHTISYWT